MMSFSNAVKSRLALLSISSHLMEFVVSVEGADGTLVGGGDWDDSRSILEVGDGDRWLSKMSHSTPRGTLLVVDKHDGGED